MAFDGSKSYITLEDGSKKIMHDFFEKTCAEYKRLTENSSIKHNVNVLVKDRYGVTNIKDIIKYHEEYPIYEIELENVYIMHVTCEHPCMIIHNDASLVVPTSSVVIGDDMMINEVKCKVVSIKKRSQFSRYIYNIVTDSGSLIVNDVWVHC